MYDDFATKLAHVITEYSTPVRKDDTVVIGTSVEGIPAAKAVMTAVLERGGFPVVRLYSAQIRETFILNANDDQLRKPDPVALYMSTIADVNINIQAPENMSNRGGIAEERLVALEKGWQGTLGKQMERIRTDPNFRWLNIIWPTQAFAQRAKMGIGSFTKYAYEALGLNHDDPVAYWETLCNQQNRLIQWCEGKRRVEIKGPNADLSFHINERPWANYHGKHHLPDGEIFTCPLEDSMTGTIELSIPWQDIEGARLTFKYGEVVEATARHNEAQLKVMLNTDAGARRVGLFGIGTNTSIKHHKAESMFPLKTPGMIHLVLGQSMPEGGGKNKSDTQFALIHDLRPDGEIRMDDELFYRGGEFMVA